MKFDKIMVQPIKFVVLRGGKLPVRQHDGKDAGLDCFIRGVIELGSEPNNRRMRTTITNLTEKVQLSADRYYCEHVHADTEGTYWELKSGESVSLGLGFNVQIPYGMAGFLYPRGCIAKEQLQILNTNPIDHGFDGEPWLELRNNGYQSFRVRHHMRLVQLVIIPVWYGVPEKVTWFKGGRRGSGSNGSTGY